ncbi:hypothetical protein GCM10009559_52170 [Pseudonocardia zijingensis]|jgi:hypothetical protein|uniref:ANTAR domain-containing protein n=1 Tax=Pseudonocardia zijingensis TaxID=153376 RepID=A0ABN1N6V6_9PSEU
MPGGPPAGPGPTHRPGGDGQVSAVPGTRLATTLESLISDLFAAGLQLQVVLQDIDGTTEPARRLRAALVRIDTTISGLRMAERDLMRVERLHSSAAASIDIAQAEGILAERLQIPIADAAAALAEYARLHGRHPVETARGVIDGTIDLSGEPS